MNTMFERPRTVAIRATVAMLVLSACTDRITDPTPAPPLAPALRADVVAVHETGASVRWNAITRDLITGKAAKPTQQGALRAFAYLSLAQYRAVAAAQDERDGLGEPSTQGAVAGASAVVLSALFPGDAAFFESQLKAQESEASDKAGFLAGEAVGRAVGAKVAELARTDRFDAVWTGTVPGAPGHWSTDAVPPGQPQLPLLGKMRPFFMTSGDQFRPHAPPAYGSKKFLRALAEVRLLSGNRTDDQLKIVKFWAAPSPSLVAGFWNEEATTRIVRDHLSERRAAHALALMNTAAMDAVIACHDAKYTYWLIRPYKALVELRKLYPDNKELQAGSLINVPIAMPPHPSYPSNHACFSGTAAYILGSLFPADATKLAAMADEAGEYRLYAGIHYRFDKDAGLRIARKVTALALRRDGR